MMMKESFEKKFEYKNIKRYKNLYSDMVGSKTEK